MNLLKFFKPKEVYVCPDFELSGCTKEARKILKEKPCPCCRQEMRDKLK